MPEIGKTLIAYKDPLLTQSLERFNNHRVERIQKEDLSKYRLKEVTLENLKRGNMTFSYDGSGTPKYVAMNRRNAYADEILFSSRKETVETNANACASYMLTLKKAGIISAMHVYTSHMNDPVFHIEMLLYAFATLTNLAPEGSITAYISGMHISPKSPFKPPRIRKIDIIRPTLLRVVEELLSRDVQITLIDIGKHYTRQIYSPVTGKYNSY